MNHCKIEQENEKLKKENKELWKRYYELQLALIDKETIELQNAKIRFDMPWYMRFAMRLFKAEFHTIIDKGKLSIWVSSYWLRSLEQ